MRSVCIIPARGGSVRIPGKNILMFHGKPMLHWSILNARASGLFDDIIVSTDSAAVIKTAWELSVRCFERQPDDGSRGTQEVAAETLDLGMGWRDSGKPAIACVLYPCAPMIS